MKQIKELISVENLINRESLNKKKELIKSIFNYAVLFVFMVAFSLLCIIGADIITGKDFVLTLKFVFVVMFVVLSVYTIVLQIKEVYLFSQKELLQYLPINKTKIYLAKFAVCSLKVVKLAMVMELTMLLTYALYIGMGLEFYLLLIPTLLLLPIGVIGACNLITMPVAIMYNWLKNKNVLKFVLMIGGTIGVFYLYINVVFEIANTAFITQENTTNIFAQIINLCSSKYWPTSFIAEYMLGNNILENIGIVATLYVMIFVIATILNLVLYKYIYCRTLFESKVSKTIKIKNKTMSPFATYFVYELKSIFRNSSFLFTYVGVALAMPFMVFACNNFILKFAIDSLGANIIFGTTLLVVLVFVTMICSPTAAFISKEGENFWILKTNPNGIKVPLFAKSLVGICFGVGSLLISLIIVIIGKYINILWGLIIFGISLIYILGLIAMGLFLNLLRPNIFHGNKENSTNLIIHLLIGFVISIGIAIFAILYSFSMNINIIALLCFATVSVFSAISIGLLLLTYKKLYSGIEV